MHAKCWGEESPVHQIMINYTANWFVSTVVLRFLVGSLTVHRNHSRAYSIEMVEPQVPHTIGIHVRLCRYNIKIM